MPRKVLLSDATGLFGSLLVLFGRVLSLHKNVRFNPFGLNRPPGGGVVQRGGQTNSRAVIERNDGLDGTLAEGGFTDNDRPLVILKCAGDDFRGACAARV